MKLNPSQIKYLIAVPGLILFFLAILSFWWSREPDGFDVLAEAETRAQQAEQKQVIGYVTTATVIRVASTLMDKSGGYLSNDVMPPGVLMDNIPNWEFGVLVQTRDLARALRNDISRSQSQSAEDQDLATAEPLFNFDSESWIFPASESEYNKAIAALKAYLNRLADPSNQNAQFYARADNLRDWLALVGKRLGGLSQRLSASVGQVRFNTDLAGDASAEQSTHAPDEHVVKTPWLELDDVFFEARGSAWALLHFLKAAEHDFAKVLEDKNARISLRQIIRELESTQDTLWSPIILNGGGLGLVANHSLVMASYMSRANAAIIDLRNLLEQG